MAHLQENLSVDNDNGEESGQPQINKAINEAICLPQTPPFGTNVEATNPLTSPHTTEKAVEPPCDLKTAILTTISLFNNPEIHQPSEEGNKVEQATDANNQKIQPEEQIIQKLLLFDVEDKKEPDKVAEYYSKIPENSTEFEYDQSTAPVHVKQLHKRAKKIGSGSFGVAYSVLIKNPRKFRIAVKNKRELCICMELMDTSIAKFYQAMHRFFLHELSPEKLNRFVQRCAYNVVRALYYLESKNIVHRDVKPANILVNKDGKIKLCDFGICGNLTDRQLDFDAVIGTVMYLPPKPEKCAVQGDMWALGISLIEIIAGKNPFTAYSFGEVLDKISKWEPVVPTTVSIVVQAFILQLLKKEADERPRSYKDIINDSFIRHMTSIPSSDEIDFIQHVIKKTNKL
ncbi:unnamed protein product [Adineta steineri]|uniref:mitogen-activated protein kinase kinase n=1 Tax=Adineta steineri TaxID=433720 RepID=A0A815ZQ54_9BILA|nr:unnamed protein product [Adineta steineri]CAF1587118.1 unnamed protein product [Adineta steineri]